MLIIKRLENFKTSQYFVQKSGFKAIENKIIYFSDKIIIFVRKFFLLKRDIILTLKKEIMSRHQVKSNITNVVNHIEVQNEVKTCFDAPIPIVKVNKRQSTTIIRNKSHIDKKNITTPSNTRVLTHKLKKNVESHDLSLVFLANDMFKGTGPIPIEGAIAFKKALLKSATTKPVFTN
jgi:hypothetical protein